MPKSRPAYSTRRINTAPCSSVGHQNAPVQRHGANAGREIVAGCATIRQACKVGAQRHDPVETTASYFRTGTALDVFVEAEQVDFGERVKLAPKRHARRLSTDPAENLGVWDRRARIGQGLLQSLAQNDIDRCVFAIERTKAGAEDIAGR